jgi:hypothetical protein
VRFFQKFADEVLMRAGDTWEITGDEIKAWYEAWKKGKTYEIYPSGVPSEPVTETTPEFEAGIESVLDAMDRHFEEYVGAVSEPEPKKRGRPKKVTS